MPLSEYEQRVLEQMEQQLYSEDPKLASAMSPSARRSGVRYVLAGAGVVVGVVLLIVGVMTDVPAVGIVGFAIMFGGVAYALLRPAAKKGPLGTVDADGKISKTAKSTKRRGSGDFMARLEERWDRRRDEGL